MELEGTGDRFLTALREYRDGRQSSLQGIMGLVRAYQGPHDHLLWDAQEPADHFLPYIYSCFEHLSEGRMVELLQALISEEPDFPLIESPDFEGTTQTFLYVALSRAHQNAWEGRDPNGGSTSFNVLRLLAVPGVTRIESAFPGIREWCTPLLQACKIQGLDPSVIHHLLDLDPGAVLVGDRLGLLPLHRALQSWTPAASAVVNRLIELSPTSLSHRGISIDLTPVMYAMFYRGVSSQHARFLKILVERDPRSVLPGVVTRYGTSLYVACSRFPDRGLIEAVVRAFPPALCVFDRMADSGQLQLPIDIVAGRPRPDRETVEFLEEETLHMALAAIEYALLSTSDSSAAAVADQSPADEFNRQVRAIVARNLPPELEPRRVSGVARTQALRADDRCMDVCREVFFLPVAGRLTWNDTSFRDAVLGESVVNLYRMNKLGRSNPSPHHQIRLLASVGDDLDCLYLQFREFGAVHLLVIANDRPEKLIESARAIQLLSHGSPCWSPQESHGG